MRIGFPDILENLDMAVLLLAALTKGEILVESWLVQV
jgi:hypothetical protein